MVKDSESNGQATEHNPHNTHESALMETKSISINPRAIGTLGPHLNESIGHTPTHNPQPTQFFGVT